MRANLSEYEMKNASDLKEVLHFLDKKNEKWKIFACGTDLMVLFEAGKLNHKNFINILGLNELKKIEIHSGEIHIGSLVTYSKIRSNEVIKKEFSLLCRAASETGALAIQNRGTLGGNIANASPAADSPPALLVYGAKLELMSTHGKRIIDYNNFHRGYKLTELKENELISKIILPRSSLKPTLEYYRKVGTRKAQAISKVCFAGVLYNEKGEISGCKIAIGSVAPVPYRCTKTEAHLIGKKLNRKLITEAKSLLMNEVAPIDDIRSTQTYRKLVSGNLLEEFLEKCGIGLAN